ncbi:MAG: hypothetical protein J0L84_05855, partial [Verrucomicrobia bacterium]|nr:hypothetical protein [Verrucomicrobiota bacterium]
RVARESGDSGDRIAHLYTVTLQRSPMASERLTAETHLREIRDRLAGHGKGDPEAAAFESLCRVMLNLNEFLYVE